MNIVHYRWTFFTKDNRNERNINHTVLFPYNIAIKEQFYCNNLEVVLKKVSEIGFAYYMESNSSLVTYDFKWYASHVEKFMFDSKN